MNARRILALGGVVLLALAAWWLYRTFFPPDEQVIRRTLQEAAQAASVKANEGPLDKLGAINRLVNACTADVVVALNVPGLGAESVVGRDSLREMVAAWRGTAPDGLAIQLIDLAVDVSEDRSRATAQFIVRARLDDQADDLLQELRVVLNRVEGRWKIQRVEPLASLQM